jgi:pimeloyl-ACP methyl ester carboxylesterase
LPAPVHPAPNKDPRPASLWQARPRLRTAGLAAISQGTGPLVVLLHGVGLRAEAWAPLIDALSQTYSVLAPDMPGHGESAGFTHPPQDRLTLQDYTDAVVPLLERPALVVGHSMGALMALDLAVRHPGKLRGVVALNAVFEREAEAAKAVQGRAAQLDGATPPDPTQTLTRWFGQSDSAERDACRTWLTTVEPAGYKAAYTTFAHAPGPSRADIAGLAIPALFMTGAEEPNSTPAMSQAMANLAPQGAARIVPDAAHMMPMTHTKDVTEALLLLAAKVLA